MDRTLEKVSLEKRVSAIGRRRDRRLCLKGNRERHDKAAGVVGVFANQVDARWSCKDTRDGLNVSAQGLLRWQGSARCTRREHGSGYDNALRTSLQFRAPCANEHCICEEAGSSVQEKLQWFVPRSLPFLVERKSTNRTSKSDPTSGRCSVLAFSLAALLLLTAPQQAQTANAAPAFEVATIRPVDPQPNEGRFIKMESANRFVAKSLHGEAADCRSV